jgi:hypothetical protein
MASAFAGGSKYLYDIDTELVENCETSDSNETNPNPIVSLFNNSLADNGPSFAYTLPSAAFDHLPLPGSTFNLDCFTPPPDFAIFS